MRNKKDWYEGDATDEGDGLILEYDITTVPNDFNVKTIFDFIESGAVVIPEFQRNYVWDIKRASKFIESIIMNLPIPQIFLYEEGRNKFLVIDGQQRLLTIYYFIKGKFPKKDKRIELRKIFDQHGRIPDEILGNKRYFEDFTLNLKSDFGDKESRLNELNYLTLKEYRSSFDMRAIRNVIIKQTKPENDDSSKYEIFSRLNTGGINLSSQEIRSGMFHSDFLDMLYKINLNSDWRNLLGIKEPDLHMKDVEVLLRSFAMLQDGEEYQPSMTRFLNAFARKCQRRPKDEFPYLEGLFCSFLESCKGLPEKAFLSKNGKFNISIFEAVFFAICKTQFKKGKIVEGRIDSRKLTELKNDPEFISASQSRLSDKKNVETRLRRATAVLR